MPQRRSCTQQQRSCASTKIWCSQKINKYFFKKQKQTGKLPLPYDPSIPLLGIYPEKTIIRKDTCTPTFIAALFTIANTWKQPKCPLTEEWIKSMWYIYTMEYYSAIRKSEMMSFAATWMDLEIVILSEVSQTEKDKYYMISLLYGI